MDWLMAFQRPITDPVYIFLILLLIIFFAPKVLKFLRIPGIVGFILAGVALGPNGFNIIGLASGVELFASIGLLYIMFLIGLELDLVDFRKNRNKSVVFGILTFTIPLLMGFFSAKYLLHMSFIPSLLLAIMFSAHTMISYPIVSKLGLSRHRVTSIVAGGTIITDTAVLLILAVILNTAEEHADPYFWLKLVISLGLLLFVLFWLVPRISKWLFRKLEGDSGGQYILLLLVLFLSAVLAKIAGIESMIGAFLAGIAMNQVIPSSSSLMNRTIFIGNTLFIPFFLISVGMLVDLRVFLQGHMALYIAGIFVFIALLSKFLAAWIMQRVYRLQSLERDLIFGLSASRAAATIALVMLGYRIHLVDIYVLNGAVAVVFITCLVSGFIAQNTGRKLAIHDHIHNEENDASLQRILIPVANPATMRQLLKFAALIKEPKSNEPLIPLSVIVGDIDSPAAQEQLHLVRSTVNDLLKKSDQKDIQFTPAIRVDLNVANGINRAIKELLITHVILGWNGKTSTLNFLFGNLLEGILPRNHQMMLVAKIDKSIYGSTRLVVALPAHTEYEPGYVKMMRVVANLSKELNARILIICSEKSKKSLESIKDKLPGHGHIDYHMIEELKDLEPVLSIIQGTDLPIFISARPRSISFNNYIAQLPRNLSKTFSEQDFVILYPEQAEGTEERRETKNLATG